jgi:phosphatidylinositol alpha-mannosyltransferase
MPKNTVKLKIGFVLDDGMDNPDGVQQYISTLGGWLEKQGHSVKYLVGETTKKDIPGLIALSKNLKVRFNRNSLSTPLPAFPRKIKRVLAKEKFDVIHVQMPYSPFMAGQVVRAAGKNTKVIGTFHVLPVGSLQYSGTKLLGYLLKGNLKRFDHFISVSEPAQVFAEQTFGIESTVLPNPVDIARFKKNTKTDAQKINIVYLGRLVPRKGCLQLLKAINMLLEKKDLPKIELHICGSGGQRKSIESYIKSSPGLRKTAVLHGFVSEDDKIERLNQADFAIFPSLGGESFGIVLIEAMAAGSGVVLAGNNPGYASVMSSVPDCLFDPKNPAELSDKLYELIKDKPKFDQIHSRQQRLVRRYDIERIGPKLLKIYEQA